MAVTVLAAVVVIGALKLVCVARQYRKGRVCMVLQVYFITQLQRTLKLQCMNWVRFTLPGSCTLCVPERIISLVSPTQTQPPLPSAVRKCKEKHTKYSLPPNTYTHLQTHAHLNSQLFTYCATGRQQVRGLQCHEAWRHSTMCRRSKCFEVEALVLYVLGPPPQLRDWFSCVT